MDSRADVNDMATLCLFDPDVFKESAKEFAEGDDRGFKRFVFPTLAGADSAIEGIFLCGEYSKNIHETRDGFRFRDWPVETLGGGVFSLPLEALRSKDMISRLEWAGQIGEYGVAYQVALRHPAVEKVLGAWKPAVTPRQHAMLQKARLEGSLDSATRNAFATIVSRLPSGTMAISFASEGLMLCIFGRGKDVGEIRTRFAGE